MSDIRTYSELIEFSTFEERINYLKLNSKIGLETFGSGRYLNQAFYKSKEWIRVRNEVIIRDNGCDLAMEGYEIYDNILVHHINPITKEDVINRNKKLFDPENLITVSMNTHNMIHYGNDIHEYVIPWTERKKNDTSPWLH